MSLKQKGLILLLILGIVLTISYVWLGGFNEISWEKKENVSLLIFGKYYEGKYGDEFIGETFLTAKEKIQSGEWQGELAVVYYNKPEESEGKVKNFIGAIVKDSSYTLEGFEYRSIKNNTALSAMLMSNYYVMPNPAIVYKEAAGKAQSYQLNLREQFIEIYRSKDQIEILFLTD